MRLKKLTMLGVALLPVVGVASSAAAADGTSAAGQSSPPVHSALVVPNTASFPSANPCTGDPGLVTLDELYVVKITTLVDGSSHFNIHAKGTFDFDATDPSAPDFFSAPERPTNIQLQVDANGNGTQTQISGYDARGTDGSRVMVHDVAKFAVVGFTTLTVTHENFQLHCSP